MKVNCIQRHIKHAYRNLYHVTSLVETSNVMRPKASYNARPGKQHQFIMDKDHMTLRCYM